MFKWFKILQSIGVFIGAAPLASPLYKYIDLKYVKILFLLYYNSKYASTKKITKQISNFCNTFFISIFSIDTIILMYISHETRNLTYYLRFKIYVYFKKNKFKILVHFNFQCKFIFLKSTLLHVLLIYISKINYTPHIMFN